MEKQKQHEQYSKAVFEKLAKIEAAVREVKNAVNFARIWDDENGMFYAFLVDRLQDVELPMQAARANLERLTELADPNGPEDLPF